MGFGGILRQSTAVDVLIGPFVDSTDGDTEETALTISQGDVMLSKNGQTSAQKNDVTACAHDADGFYNCELDATDTNTVGQLTLYVHEAGALAVRHDYQVIEEVIYDALYAASANAWAGAAGSTTVTALAAGSVTAAVIATGAIDADAIADNAIDAGAIAADAITAAKIANGAIDAATFAADVDAEILSYIVDDATRIDASALNTAAVTSVPAILVDTNELQTDWTNGGRLDLLLDATLADTNELQTDWADGGRLDLILDARASQTSVNTIDDFLDTEIAAILEDTGTTLDDLIDTEVAAIKTKTDSLTFTVANQLDANVQSINDVTVLGDGGATPWGP